MIFLAKYTFPRAKGLEIVAELGPDMTFSEQNEIFSFIKKKMLLFKKKLLFLDAISVYFLLLV